MRRHLLLISISLSLGACKTSDDEVGDTDVAGTDEVTGDTDPTTSDDTTGQDTDVQGGGDTDVQGGQDTDVAVPFEPIGTWTLSAGVVTSYTGCLNPPQMHGDTSVEWSEPYAPSVQLKMSAFSDEFNCTRAGNVISCQTMNYRSNYTGYYVVFSAGLSMTLGANDGEATVVRTDTRVCTETSGMCSLNAECSGVFTWSATQN